MTATATGAGTATGAATAATDLARAEVCLRRARLRLDHRLDGIVHGDHDGLGPGSGTDAADARDYAPGDDVRRIDWNLSARTGSLQVRGTIAERELETWFVVDGSASLDYGTAAGEKRDVAAAVAAAFGVLVAGPGHRTGAVVFDAAGSTIVPAAAGGDALIRLVAGLHRRDRAGSGDASLAAALRRADLLARRRGLVVVISDLLDPSDWGAELRRLSARHRVVVAHLTDPREDELPPVGMLVLVDPESGRRHEVQTSDRGFRERYAAAARRRRTQLADIVRHGRAAYLPISTEDEAAVAVGRFATTTGRRR